MAFNFDKRQLQAQMLIKDVTSKQLSEALQIDLSTFYRRLNDGNFSRNEIATLIDVLEIEDPMKIFFAL